MSIRKPQRSLKEKEGSKDENWRKKYGGENSAREM
jgi:hypothetical protein